MDINELKTMLKSSTAVLVIDNGEPRFVIMDYGSYKEMSKCESEREVKINGKEIEAGSHPADVQNRPAPVKSEGELELLEKIIDFYRFHLHLSGEIQSHKVLSVVLKD